MMGAQLSVLWFRRIALLAGLIAIGVVVLGAWVRLTDAGLGCPDWPGCYGHVYPTTAAQHVGKAWHEMIHRYAVGALSTLILLLAVWALVRRHVRGQPLGVPLLLLLVVCLQAALGAFTVTMQLAPLVVTSHLLGGLTTLGLLWFLSLEPGAKRLTPSEVSLRGFAVIGAIILVLQIALGGWTSSNYAAVACPDLPTCQGAWWPTSDFRDAFVLWRGLGINYEGGVLPAAARVAIQLTHRLGAVIAGCTLLALGAAVAIKAREARLRFSGALLVVAVLLQISLGLATVHWAAPLPVATLHNAGAALLVLTMVTLLRSLWPTQATGVARA